MDEIMVVKAFPDYPSQLVITLNCKAGSIYDLPESGETGSSDEFDPRPIYEHINHRPAGGFCSCAARVGVDSQCPFLSSYGNIVLVLDPGRIREDLLTFNGDLKDLSQYIRDADYASKSHALPLEEDNAHQFHGLLKLPSSARATATRPIGRYGQYFEARLFRPLQLLDALWCLCHLIRERVIRPRAL